MSRWRTIIALSRPAMLPTIWSHCIAGWWLGGGGHLDETPLLFLSATLIYLGAAFLHDFFDSIHDEAHHPERPIPSKAISEQTVWRSALALLLAGEIVLVFAGTNRAIIGLILCFVVVIGNALHRPLRLGPAAEALSRVLIYVLAASFGERGLNGWAIWCGLALGCFRLGIAFLERKPGLAQTPNYWPTLLFAVPVALALLMDNDRYRESGLLLSGILILWTVRSLRPSFWSQPPDPPQTISGLIAAMVFVDWLATCPLNLAGAAGAAGRELSFAFLALFGSTLLIHVALKKNTASANIPAASNPS